MLTVIMIAALLVPLLLYKHEDYKNDEFNLGRFRGFIRVVKGTEQSRDSNEKYETVCLIIIFFLFLTTLLV